MLRLEFTAYTNLIDDVLLLVCFFHSGGFYLLERSKIIRHRIRFRTSAVVINGVLFTDQRRRQYRSHDFSISYGIPYLQTCSSSCAKN